jgi:hypothetical protein
MAGNIPALDITSFRNKFITGARSYFFYLQPTFPSQIGADVTLPIYLVRASSLPSSNFDELTTSWMGMDYKTAGKRSYDTWNVSFNVDKDAVIRRYYNNWLNMMLNPETNVLASPIQYQTSQFVTLLGLDQTEKMTYELVYAWPSSVAEVSLDYANSDYAQFDVTFTYQFYKTTP